jgi:hypothetical protein
MKKSILAVLISLFTLLSYSQNEVIFYSSYKDYQNKTGRFYKDYEGVKKGKILAVSNGDKIEFVSFEDYWGFTYKGTLFRTVRGYSAAVVSSGNVWYYENGFATLSMLSTGVPSSSAPGYNCFLSISLESEIFGLPSMAVSGAKKEYKRFKKLHPEFYSLYNCLGNITNYKIARVCIEKFNGADEDGTEDDDESDWE